MSDPRALEGSGSERPRPGSSRSESPGSSPTAEPLRVRPRRYSPLRRGVFRALEEGAAWLGGRRWYQRRSLAPGRFRLRRERVVVPGLPAGLEGAVVAQFSDLHAGRFMGDGDLEHVVAAVNAVQPELAVITGDLITRDWREALFVLDDLASLELDWGCYAVFGNHDYKNREEHLIEQAYASRGIQFLRNACARIDTGDGVLAITGVEDIEEGRLVDVAAARAELLATDVELALCHNPLGGPQLARPGCVAVLSGHTHGNQIDLPILRRLGPVHPGPRREQLHAPGPDGLPRGSTVLITSLGLGVVGIPLRICAPAEVVLVELTAEGPRAR